jgi:hypothetical protein
VNHAELRIMAMAAALSNIDGLWNQEVVNYQNQQQ